MRSRFAVFALMAGLLIVGSVSAFASDVGFTATLRGDADPTNTGSKATGAATLVVHTDAQTVDVKLGVKGLRVADFAHHLAHAPVGPMHLHIYAADGSVSLLLPFPMGPAYRETADGFDLTLAGYSYAEGAAILKSDISFPGFVDAMRAGFVIMNVHTNAFPDGEISGLVVAAH